MALPAGWESSSSVPSAGTAALQGFLECHRLALSHCDGVGFCGCIHSLIHRPETKDDRADKSLTKTSQRLWFRHTVSFAASSDPGAAFLFGEFGQRFFGVPAINEVFQGLSRYPDGLREVRHLAEETLGNEPSHGFIGNAEADCSFLHGADFSPCG